MILHRPRSPVDPVLKSQIKLQLKQRELEEINRELEVKVLYHRQMTGLELLAHPAHLQHPLILHLMDRREKLQRQIEVLQSQQAYRPTTCQLTQLVDRILSFPVTSPVIKFLTGLELLLEKAQEWESNAARHVSMATQLGEVSAQILEWRKLELSCWRQCLDNVFLKQSSRANKWWFHVYRLTQSVCVQDESDRDDEDDVSFAEVPRALKEFLFLERSSLGEFEARLGILRSFHCHAMYLGTEDTVDRKPAYQDQMIKLLWNLHQFYSQFLPLVREKIQRLRQPIEKELKGFVKIARWTDMNYWALKQTTEKTHRALHKQMKAFQAVLDEQVQGILADPDLGLYFTGHAWSHCPGGRPTLHPFRLWPLSK